MPALLLECCLWIIKYVHIRIDRHIQNRFQDKSDMGVANVSQTRQYPSFRQYHTHLDTKQI